ncbi:MAG: deoxynucleoside kinase [Oscillospiraceae bacterium]|jgi:dTMP kinase|nr:deoxynucleoside kinase [Oscillospiraceae bacterium]
MGRLIVFEGIDGSGKSTQFKLMCDRLNDEDIVYKRIFFPRYEEPSSALIRMYLAGDFGKDPDTVNAYAASSFFAVDRYASFVQDWRDYYKNDGLILTDRYTTSNALHQGAKMVSTERKKFFDWLYDYEFNLIELPKPDAVVFIDVDVELAAERLNTRQKKTGTSADIHENDMKYLASCVDSGRHAAKQFGWYIVDCSGQNAKRSENDIHSEIFNELFKTH